MLAAEFLILSILYIHVAVPAGAAGAACTSGACGDQPRTGSATIFAAAARASAIESAPLACTLIDWAAASTPSTTARAPGFRPCLATKDRNAAS